MLFTIFSILKPLFVGFAHNFRKAGTFSRSFFFCFLLDGRAGLVCGSLSFSIVLSTYELCALEMILSTSHCVLDRLSAISANHGSFSVISGHDSLSFTFFPATSKYKVRNKLPYASRYCAQRLTNERIVRTSSCFCLFRSLCMTNTFPSLQAMRSGIPCKLSPCTHNTSKSTLLHMYSIQSDRMHFLYPHISFF